MGSARLDLIGKQVSLILTVKRGRSDDWCLRLWSRFIKARDDYQCVVCFSTDRVQAYHIFRKPLVCLLSQDDFMRAEVRS